jgi:pyruvate/2-oxoglutarate dehydrogenase complex dihydrolipoamide dehydrogenase (E3) component
VNRLPGSLSPVSSSPTAATQVTARPAAQAPMTTAGPVTGLAGAVEVRPTVPVPVPAQTVHREPAPAGELSAEVVVIGAGSAGIAAAEGIAAGAVTEETTGRAPARRCPLRVAVVDDAPAGQGGWSGRLALAALHEAASRRMSWSQAGAYLREVRADVVTRHEERLLALRARLGPRVLVLSGRGRLAGPGRVLVEPRGAASTGPRQLSARRVVLSTGCVPGMPEVTGLLDTAFLTATDLSVLLDADRPPASAAVLGAGSTGCALAQALARLGVGVTLIDEHPRLLSGEDADAAAVVAAGLERDGVRLLLGSPVVKVAPTLDGGAWLGTAAGVDVAAERLVVAAGWRAATGGLDLPSAGVAVGPAAAITVDSALVTSVPDVLAAGGVVAGEPHAGAALAMGAVAGANAVSRRPTATWSTAAVAALTLTDPEVASVGLTGPGSGGPGSGGPGPEPTGAGPTDSASMPGRRPLPGQGRSRDAAGSGVGVGTVRWSEVDRAVLSGVEEGFVRVVVGCPASAGNRWVGRRTASATVRVLGATVVGSRAGDLVAPLALAIGSGLPASALASTVSADPTWSSALRTAVARAWSALP